MTQSVYSTAPANCANYLKEFLIYSLYINILKRIDAFKNMPDVVIMVRVYANGSGDLRSIPGRVTPKTKKMVLDATLLSTQHYKVRFKGKVEQLSERSSALPYAWRSSYQKGSFGSPSTTVANSTLLTFSLIRRL